MTSREDVFNVALANILEKMRSNWTVSGQTIRTLKSSKQPDIITEEKGTNPIIIETEFKPARTLEGDMEKKLGQTSYNEQKVAAVIGVKAPSRLKRLNQTSMELELVNATDLEYAVLMPHRFPTEGWITGTPADIARIAQTLSVSKSDISQSVDIIESSVNYVANLIEQSGTDTKFNIAKFLQQKENVQTWKIAGLILANAFIFQSRIAGERGIKNFMQLRIVGIVPIDSLIESWEHILDTNYFSIFQVAKDILTCIREEDVIEIIDKLVKTSGRITAKGMSRSIDLYGSLIQRMIRDRKTLASFYTLPESAALLASIVSLPANSDVYKNADTMCSIKCADFACGTGTLLTSMYRNMIQNYEINGNDMAEIHDKIMEKSMYGLDVLPSAAHLTVSSLANFFPRRLFRETNIKTAWYGMQNGVYHLGSLNLILDSVTFDKKGETIRSKNMDVYYNPNVKNNMFDVIVMNPPFTGNTREGGKEGHAMFKSFDTTKDVQKKMTDISIKIFHSTCSNGNAGYATHFLAIADKKLKPGGMMGFILPATIHYGSSWNKVRDMFALRYENITVISIAAPTIRDAAFSADTGMNEIIIVARKKNASKLDEITMLENRIAELKKSLKKVQNARKKIRINVEEIKKYIKINTEQLDSIKQKNRGKFVSLYERPNSILSAIELGKIIKKQSDPVMLDKNTSGGVPMMLGNRPYGTILDCPVAQPWWFVCVFDSALLQCAYMLKHGKLNLIGSQSSYSIPMTELGDRLGLSTRDIGEYIKNSNGRTGNDRSPFFITPLPENIRAARYALWGNDNQDQTSILVEPDSMATEKKHAPSRLVINVDNTCTRLHINRLARFSSQSLIAFFTEEKSFGGESLPNVVIDEKYEKALAVWGNSTLGILCYWASSGKQHLGRGLHSRTSLQNLDMLDCTKLKHGQLNKLNKAFDKYKLEPLLKIKNMHKDENRKALDKAVLDALGINVSLDDLRIRLCLEPTINDGMPDSELLK